MPLLGAIGIGVLILVLKSLSPTVLHQGEATVIALLHTIEVAASAATDITASVHEAGTSSFFTPPILPRAPDIRP